MIAGQSFRAPFHVSKPYWDADSRVLLTQVVNPTAGILEGDAHAQWDALLAYLRNIAESEGSSLPPK